MQSFLEEVVKRTCDKYISLENIVFVLPSKRAGTFLRHYIGQATSKTIFAPQIFGIEGFVEKISGLTYATNTQQLFELYYTYLEQHSTEPDSFLDFSKWAQTLLQDFNELDRHLVDPKRLFSNLSAIQEINHWHVSFEKTKLMQDYIRFWNNLEDLHSAFSQRLLDRNLGHQGLVYRQACLKLDSYLQEHKDKVHIFIGFNALNTAESNIIQSILQTSTSEIYWDLDSYFLDDPVHDAGFFIRQHQKTWPYLQKKGLMGIGSHFLGEKDIHVIGVPKNVSQAKYVATLLQQLAGQKNAALKNTAVVLGDETLLNPLLNSIPPEIKKANITMGYPLNKTPFDAFFMQFFELHLQKQPNGWYHKNVRSFLSNPHTLLFLGNGERGFKLFDKIKSYNTSYLNLADILKLEKDNQQALSLFFWEDIPNPIEFVERCIEIILGLKSKLQASKNETALETLYRFYNVFDQVYALLKRHGFIKDLKSLHALFKELLSVEHLDFEGNPLQGLQIMGMLESRNLDFETVIITSVNEGILPSGKSNNSFIPFDLKQNFGLPTFKEKDAVYTYHFYRLLQRAKHIYLLYNTEPDVLEGGERSRLITQLLTDENVAPSISEYIGVPKIGVQARTKATIPKNDPLMALVKAHAKTGFSPTSLSTYIRNPLDFYKQTLLGIDDSRDMEETIAANTFGTIIHDSLEDLYRPFIRKYMTKELLGSAKRQIPVVVKKNFSKTYADATSLRERT